MPALPAGRNTIFDIGLPGEGGPDIPPYAARGLHGTLRPIDMAQGADKLRRTVNGTLISVAAPQMRKFRLEASGDDQQPPALDNIWPGMELAVYCHVEMAFMTSLGGPAYPVVPDSEYVEGEYTFYAMSLSMLVAEWTIERAEWSAQYTWTLVLEER